MLVVGIILSLGLLGLIIYFAISRKSSRRLKFAAIIALACIGVSLIICGYFIIRGPGADKAALPFPALVDGPAPVKQRNIADLIILAVLVAVVGVVIFISLRDKRKKAEPAKRKAEPVFQESDDLDIEIAESPVNNNSEDSFDIELE